jgi:GH15 family glucan-1,4-alpha-glucosidase
MSAHSRPARRSQPPIGDYALLADGRTAALVSREGSVDWWCPPRFDAPSAFGRLLDWERGGCCAIAPAGAPTRAERREYLGDTLVLATTFRTASGEVRVLDCLPLPDEDRDDPGLLRIVEGRAGEVELDVRVAPRFDYAAERPALRRLDGRLHLALGSEHGLEIACDSPLAIAGDELRGRVSVRAGERLRLWVGDLSGDRRPAARAPAPEQLDARLQATLAAWREWAGRIRYEGPNPTGVRRSALVLKALTYEPTGAIVAAPTTSLPERIGSTRTWDYRYAWVRDSSYSARSLAELGCEEDANRFRRFIERAANDGAEDLEVAYDVGGDSRIEEHELPLAGYAGSRPVRVGNAASGQLQLDCYGEVVSMAWRWHRRGHSPDAELWGFLRSLVDWVAAHWSEPDAGIWEWRGAPEHFVHSKALCWSALDRGIQLAQECGLQAPVARWAGVREEVRAAIDEHGYDRERGVFVQTFGRRDLDAALLLLPTVGFVGWEDERMRRTAAAIRRELDAGDGDGALLYRYVREDGIDERGEGAFLACSFWLAEQLARGGDPPEAERVFAAACATANDLDLFSEELDPRSGQLVGNFPQALTHLAHVAAGMAIAQAREPAVKGG